MAKPGNGTKDRRERTPGSDGRISETDLASDIHGRNKLQGDDQANVHNQRQAVPDAKQEADEDPVESAKLLDKDERARRELSKGARSGKGKPAGPGDDEGRQ